ncbi:MAG: hypothetical protein GWN00_17520, partial [Aliifodinibius sp.]|nr:hypothetical protein [Fodinibius sp.]NIY26536.1 hypothetical protein [Fodinibius sp.]
SDYSGQTLYQVLPRSRDDLTINNLQPMVKEGSFIYADIDTTSETIYMLLESGLWGYNLSGESWRFLDALNSIEEPFSSYEFGFNTQTGLIQLWSSGMGKPYSVDPKTFNIESEGHLSKHKNQFGHFPFYRDSTLYAFGGYGYWNYHNMIVHFNHSQNKWVVQSVSRSSPHPNRRIPTTGTYDRQKDQLYIFGGRGTKSGYAGDRNTVAQNYRDIWGFSFDNQQWKKIMSLGKLKNGAAGIIHPLTIGKTNKGSSSLYLPED